MSLLRHTSASLIGSHAMTSFTINYDVTYNSFIALGSLCVKPIKKSGKVSCKTNALLQPRAHC